MVKKKPTILVVNDDGITAPGIKVLIEEMQKLGHVVVVAPDSPQSGMGHAITIGKPLRLDKVNLYEGVEMYKCSGTPVDCVKLAVNKIFKGKKPDICVSGINHGLNNSINVLYSGTMSAAVEGAIESIPSIGFSLDDFTYDANFDPCRPYIVSITQQVLNNGLPKNTLLNVNFPQGNDIKGIKICRQAGARWVEEFDERVDPHNRDYFWLTGKFQLEDRGEDTDAHALNHGYVSVVPTQYDMTAHHAIPELNSWSFDV
ncbi:5'/3'-nucleotidase SurE [Sphingobacterium spiritivorum]|uniref:5'-nucleotidase SurE n=2 Tax=Sphingobacterium spiritivorum TaxID=258 RepID=D7VIU1_SPHSI|nr:5'/3'-nucleotidase SurE [Sphingobacterium spiritivorum]EFK59993.1 5'/3'-nucleotidase SurE [Sphingobacterium spiritivorum ATCC 33861]QQT37377.1 5'/3'-nucleotidase SurE [Sphingobacterium spiritivorum]WQD34168.1 5'/3'-nucleotidase SurE [Sphingobacterium spiritivorum]SUI96990.1 5'-nucleotidase surE [Sphingobacterium spiritivorum]SUJ15408.1 5'-nucleotidase surE [Sphingobacterium spiritivorum]